MQISLITDLVQIGYFVVMLVLLLWALRMHTITREPLFAWFSAMQVMWLVHNFLAFGYDTTLMPGIDRETTTVIFRFAVIVAAILSVAFHRALLSRFRPAILTLRMFDLQLASMLVALVIFSLVDRRLGLQINAYSVAATPFVFLACILTAHHEAPPGLTTMRVIYATLTGTLLLWVFSLLGFSTIRVWALYGFMVHGLSTGTLMFIILHLQGRHLAAVARSAAGQLAAMEHQRNIQREKARTLAEFIDMLTHEARNALAVINMSISDRAPGERQRQRLAGAIGSLTRVIDRCNQTVRLEGDDQPVTREDCDLVGILHKLCSDTVDCRSVAFRADGPAVISADPVLLSVIFSNLIENALKYSPPDSEVSVALETITDGVSVVFDNIEGLAGRPDPDHVFEKYYRNNLARAYTGSGLGLYIVRGLVERMGGRVSYVPTDEHLRFRIWFPC
jgi:signal transduction histidine kinase